MAYIGNTPGVSSQRIVDTFIATAGQTTFTTTSGYTLGYVDVYYNGVKLVAGDDFTAATGSTIVLASGAALGDSVEIVAYLPRGLSDGYLKSEADAKYLTIANPSYTGTLTGGTGAITIGTNHFVKDASGNVGIGTATTPFRFNVVGTSDIVKFTASAAGQLLALTQTSANPVIVRMTNNSNNFWDTQVNTDNSISWDYNDAERARFDTSGNFLLGATAPKNSGGYDSNRTFLTIAAKTGGVDRGAFLELVGTAGGSPNYWLGRVDFCSSGNPKAHAAIYAFTDSGGANSGALIFGTGNSANTTEPTERARINSSGTLVLSQGMTATGSLQTSGIVYTGAFIFSGGGTQTVLTIGAGESYLFYSPYTSYGAGDHRHGIYYLAGRSSQTATGVQISGLSSNSAFSTSTSGVVTYSAGGGNPYVQIYYLRLS